MKFDNKTFQQKYEAWKNGADYWKDIRGINLGGNTQAEEPSPEEQQQIDQSVQSILNAYNEGKDVNIAEDIIKPLPFDTPLNEEHPILHKYKGGKNTAQNFYNEMVQGGVDPIIAAGIAGNVQQESSFMYNATSKTGKYKGYAQLSPELRSYVSQAYGGYDHSHQMQFLIDMAKGAPRESKNKLYNEMKARAKAFTQQSYVSPEAAAHGWETYFEKSGGQGIKNRAKYARSIYDNYYKPITQKTAADIAAENIQASPILINSISLQKPSTIRADVPATLLGPTQEEIKAQQQRNLDQYKQQMYDKITQPSLPNILNLLPQNNFGKDSYGQKFWQRRGNNMHFKGGKDGRSFNDWSNKASAYKGIKIKSDPTYDYKGWYNEDPNRAYALLNDDPSAHFDDKWKTPYHPTFSDQSVYSNAKHPGGTWGRRDFRDIYYAPFVSNVPFDRRLNYIIDAENNGAMIANNAGMIPKVKDVYWEENGWHGYDLALDPNGDFYGGTLPAVKVTGKRGKK